MRKFIKLSLVLLVFVIGGLIFYFYFPQIWGSAVYPLEYEDIIVRYAKEYKISPSFIAAVIYTESRFHKDSVSSVGATGLMQIMPSTGARLAKTLGDTDFSTSKLYEPERNIRYGSYYLKELIDRHQGDMDKALMAYNGGEGAVISFETRNTLPRETQGFVRKVKSSWETYQKVYGSHWQEIELQELERQRQAQLQREWQAQIDSKKAQGEILNTPSTAGFEFKIFWPNFRKETK